MASDRVPEEYLDVMFHEFAYDPIRLPLAEDPTQLLYNRRTLETIWVIKHEAINPYTRQPFHIKNAIPQTELRQEMQRYITENRIPGVHVIPDYTEILSQSEMRHLLKDLVSHYRHISQKENENKEEADWKVLWQKLNLIRLYCQYGESNRELFSLIQGYKYLFMVVDTQLQSSYSSSEESREVCREVAKIVDIVGFRLRDLETIPENSIVAFVHILSELGQSKYLKIQSMVLKIYCQMFNHNIDIDFPLLNQATTILPCVIQITLKLLGRRKSRDKIIDEDLHNGTAILKAAWMWRNLTFLQFANYVDILVKVVTLCVSRYQEHLLSSSEGEEICIGKALNSGFELIEAIAKARDFGALRFLKRKLEELDIVKEIVRIVELVVEGVEFEPSHVQFGLVITAELVKRGRRKLRRKEIEVFSDFLQSDTVEKYITDVTDIALGDIITMSASHNRR